MLKAALGSLGAVLLAILLVAATRPDTYQIRRQTHVLAPPELIYELIGDLGEWPNWWPEQGTGTNFRSYCNGQTRLTGAVCLWGANGSAVDGRTEILDSAPPAHVRIRFDRNHPVGFHDVFDVTLLSDGDATDVTWTARGPIPYALKLAGLFSGTDPLVSAHVEQGLIRLKSVAETRAAARAGGAQNPQARHFACCAPAGTGT